MICKIVLLFGLASVDIKSALAIDPVRPDDQVEVYFLNKWIPGVVVDYANKKVKVRYKFVTMTEKIFPLNEVRFPMGESEWRSWTDSSGKFRITARMVGRTETHVTLLNKDGKKQTLPIEKLSASNQKLIEKYAKFEKELKEASPVRVGDDVEYLYHSTWFPAKVISLRPNEADIEFFNTFFKKKDRATVQFSKLRYPNGGGPWTVWADITGKHKLTARYLSHDEVNVYLLQEGNKRVTIARNKLDQSTEDELKRRPILSQRPKLVTFDDSGIDLDKLPGWMDFNKNAPDIENSRITVEPVGQIEGIRSGFFIADLETLKVDEKENRSSSGGLTAPDVATDKISVASPGPGARGGSSFDSQVKYSVSIIPTDDPTLILVELRPSKNSEYDALKTYWLDLRKLELSRGPSFFDGEFVVAYSTKEKRLLTQEGKDFFVGASSYCVYSIEPKQRVAKSIARWNVPKISYAGSSKITGTFLPNGRVLIGNVGKLQLWNVDEKKLEAACDAYENYHRVTLDGKYILVRHFSSSSFVDSSTLKPVLKIGESKSVLSNDNRYLWVNSFRTKSIYDLTNGTKLVSFSGEKPVNSFSVLDDQWVVSDNALWSRDRNLISWSFGFDGVQSLWAGVVAGSAVQLASYEKDENPTKFLIGISDGKEIATNQVEPNYQAIDFFVLKPGAKVKIDQAVTDGRIRDGLKQSIVQAGWVEDSTSQIVVTGTAYAAPATEKTYGSSPFGFSSRGEDLKLTVSPWLQSVVVSRGENMLWNILSGGAPSMVLAPEGSSIEAEVRKCEQPSYDFFGRVPFPEKVIDPKYSGGIGSSNMTSSGFIHALQ